MPPITSALGLDTKVVVEERSQALIQGIDHIAMTHVLWLPSSTLKGVIDHVEQRARQGAYVSIPLTREDDIVAAADLRSFKLDERVPTERWSTSVVAAWEHAYMTHRPVLLLCNLL